MKPEDQAAQHMEMMKRIARLHLDEKSLRYLARNETLDTLQEIFKEVDDSFS